MKKMGRIVSGIVVSLLLLLTFSSVLVADTTEKEYVINDSSYNLETYVNEAKSQSANHIKIGTTINSIGTTHIDSSISKITGWQIKDIFSPEGIKERTVGYMIEGYVIFDSGSNVEVNSISFYKRTNNASSIGAKVVIDAGATVYFKNCKFSNTVVNNGSAVFENCTFVTGDIENNGIATYTGSTVEPTNSGIPTPGYIPLGMTLNNTTVAEGIKGTSYNQNISYNLFGTNKDTAQVNAVISDDSYGLEATVNDSGVSIIGTPLKAGSFTVTITAQDTGTPDEVVSKEVQVTIQDILQLSLSGALDAVTVGQTGYYDSLDVYVQVGDNAPITYNEYRQSHPNSVLDVQITPTGSGMFANYFYDKVTVGGTPAVKGEYQVIATLTEGVQVATSNGSSLRLYVDDLTLAQRLSTVPSNVTEWDMEPYEISICGNAIIPKNLQVIYGSHESGLYGIIGNNKTFASEILTVPAGSDVTLENIKVYSSTKIIVEKGASLTLKDSVAFGPVEVNGGTFSMANSGSLVNSLTLNDGSTLKDATIVSHGRLLTDGSRVAPDAPAVVIINGNVQAIGDNIITGESGDAYLAGQTALSINGKLTIPAGSTLTAVGGGDAIYAPQGGHGVLLNNGEITGEGTLIAIGGIGYNGNGGDGISGTGILSIKKVISTGGDSKSLWGDEAKGGDAVATGIQGIEGAEYILTGGNGSTNGISTISLFTPKMPDFTPGKEETGAKKETNVKENATIKISKKSELPKTGGMLTFIGSGILCLGLGAISRLKKRK